MSNDLSGNTTHKSKLVHDLLHETYCFPKSISGLVCGYYDTHMIGNYVDILRGLDCEKLRFCKPFVTSALNVPNDDTGSNEEQRADFLEHEQKNIGKNIGNEIHFWSPVQQTIFTFNCTHKKFIREKFIKYAHGSPRGLIVSPLTNKIYLRSASFIKIYSLTSNLAAVHQAYDTTPHFDGSIPKNMEVSPNYDKIYFANPDRIVVYDILETGEIAYTGNNIEIKGIKINDWNSKKNEYLPISLCENMLYALDSCKNRVHVFNVLTMAHSNTWTLIDSDGKQILNTIDITVHTDCVYVCEKTQISITPIHVFSINGHYICNWKKPEHIAGYPSSIVFNDDGVVFEAFVTFVHESKKGMLKNTTIVVFK